MGYVEFPFVTICNLNFSMYHCGSVLLTGKEIYPSLKHPDRLWGLSNLLFNRYGGLFPAGLKRPGSKADHWTLVLFWAVRSLPHMTSWRAQRGKFTFTFYLKSRIKRNKNIPVQRLAYWRVFKGSSGTQRILTELLILLCGNEIPTRCNRGFYCRSYCLLNMFRASLYPSSGAQEYYTVVAACGILRCGFFK